MCRSFTGLRTASVKPPLIFFLSPLKKQIKPPKPLQSHLPSRNEAETPNRNIATNQIIYRLRREKRKYIHGNCSIPLVSIFSPFCFGTRNSQHVTVRSGYLWLQQCLRSVVLVKWHRAQATLYKKQRRHRHGIWRTSDTTLKWCDHCYRSCPNSRILAHAELGTAMAKQLGGSWRGNSTSAAAELMQPGSPRRADLSCCTAECSHDSQTSSLGR